jgi:hypothetical protein
LEEFVMRGAKCVIVGLAGLLVLAASAIAQTGGGLGREVAVPRHLQDGEELEVPIQTLMSHGRLLFNAMWTAEEGGGRPLTNGVGTPLADPSDPLVFPRNFNRVSGPDSNSCAGCHNLPMSGGGGDIVGNVFVLANRFDFATFNPADSIPKRGATDEQGDTPTLQQISNNRATTGMFGSGYLEMAARQITGDLQAIRNGLLPGGSAELISKGISYGTLSRNADGSWDVSGVEGISAISLRTSGPDDPPSLVIRPWHQASAVVSLREFSVNAFNQHHGIQATERFGMDTDPDGDGFSNEMTRADVTAVSVWQATLPVPGRVIPSDPGLQDAVWEGEQLFEQIGCGGCHMPRLPLDNWGWIFTEPDPYNPAGNLRPGDAPTFKVNLNSKVLPPPRLVAENNEVTWVPAYTDLKLHDITSGPNDPNREVLNMQFPAGSEEFFAGNSRFLSKRLWGVASLRPYFHHGLYTTLRQAILAHAGEAQAVTDEFNALSDFEQATIIEFLKTLQILPRGTRALVIDDRGRPIQWPPAGN